jgi:DNA replication protein DnaC
MKMEVSNQEPYCKKHDRTKEKLEFGERRYYNCSECGKEHDIEREKKSEERRIKSRQGLINGRLENAMIMPRFEDKTIDNFETKGPAQTKAKKSAYWFLENMSTSTGMIFIGKPGTGKNHLATGIVKKAINEYKKTALMTEAIKIIRSIKESWRNSEDKESDIIKSFRDPDILVIDEIGVQFGSDTERMYLTEIINDRYNYKKPTIIMGNLSIADLLDKIGERPIDRLRDGGKVVIFDWESQRGK